jgi:hypothetical protein
VLGPEQALLVRGMLERSAHQTPWVKAGLATVDGVLTGDPQHHLAAARIYADMGNLTDRMLSQAAAVPALRAAGRAAEAEPLAAEVAEFARRNHATRLAAQVS